MGACAKQAEAYQRKLETLRADLARMRAALPQLQTAATSAGAGLCRAATGIGVYAAVPLDAKAASAQLRDAASSLAALQPAHSAACRALEAASGSSGARRSSPKRAASAGGRSKSGSKAPIDFSGFTKARWEAERRKGLSMLGGEDDSEVKVWIQEMPRSVPEEKPCAQVKGRHIQVSNVEKIRKVFQELALSGTVDKGGFIRGVNFPKFQSLAKERSDCPSKAKGGDLGWLNKAKGPAAGESKLMEVALVTPRGACSPPFKSGNAFHIFLCEERKS